ncbi:DUF3060 domain-containing protein [Acidisphaera sp. L21]|uniref:DUF3060 domain-containing protein n=1 Tax=Acidisphaera sp. L21 TaxID=1641851 RepID=UPI001C207A9E|nr:DUF3060 domain-containing protein [Acidisphaera sp. L21]
MPRTATIPAVSIAVLLALSASARAQPVSAQSEAIDCANSDASVTGDGRHVAFHGACRSLTVRGNQNQVQAELAPGARVHVQGDGNSVRYHLLGGTIEANVSIEGQQDVVGPDAAPIAGEASNASRPPLVLSAGAASDAECTDRDVMVDGNGGDFTLHGGCRSVSVMGTGTTVHAEMQAQGRISVPGAHDSVVWFLKSDGAPPTTEVTGANSTVIQQQRLGSQIAPASAAPSDTGGRAPLQLTSGGEQQCDGRDVQINASGSNFVLQGHCRSLSVMGSNDIVEIELLPGSRVAIDGDSTIVQFLITSAGPDPIVSANGTGSKAYRVQRLGASDRQAASAGVTPTASGMKVEGGRGASVTEMPAVTQQSQPQ